MSVSATVVWGVTKQRSWQGQNRWPLTSGTVVFVWPLKLLFNRKNPTVQKEACVWHRFLCFTAHSELFFSCQDTSLLSLLLWSKQRNAAWRNFLLWLEWISFSSRKNVKCSVEFLVDSFNQRSLLMINILNRSPGRSTLMASPLIFPEGLINDF